MKVKLQYYLLLLFQIFNIILAEKEFKGDCKEIREKLIEYNYKDNFRNCVEDEEGKVTELRIFSYCFQEDEFNSILSYDTIKKLDIDIYVPYPAKYEQENIETMECGLTETLPSGLSKLNNLEILLLEGFSNFQKNDLKKIPSSVKTLLFGDYSVPQYVIDELPTLTNLEELQLEKTKFDLKLNLEPLKELKISSLTLKYGKGKLTDDTYYIPEIINYFNNLKKLTITGYLLDQKIIDEISNLNENGIYLENLSFRSCGFEDDTSIDSLKKLKSLKYLEFFESLINCSIDNDLFGDKKCPLTNVPESIFKLPSLEELVIYGQNGVTFSFPSEPIENGNLKNFTIRFCYSSSISEKIGNLRSLENLSITFTNIESLDGVEKLENLKKLYITSESYTNKILTELPKDFGNLKNLEYIYLNNQKIETLPESFGDLTNLKYINMNFNILKKLPDSFGNLKNLKECYIRVNNLRSLPENFGNLTNLVILDLSYNRISEIPDSFFNLKNLEILGLYGNLIYLSEGYGNLVNLKEFNTSDCKGDFPKSLANLQKLTVLNLINCEFASIPDEIGEITNLKILNLIKGTIKELPKTIGNLKNLEELYLSEHELTVFPEELSSLKNLKSLDLSKNQIDDEIPESYQQLTELTYLNFSKNINIKGVAINGKKLTMCSYGDIASTKDLCTIENLVCNSSIKLCTNITATTSSSSSTTTTTSTTITTTTTTSIKSESTTSTTKPVTTTTSTTKPVTTTITSTTTTKPVITTTKTSKYPISTNTSGKCGKDFGSCPSNGCCSKDGYCGKTDDYCAITKGCQSEFGHCNKDYNINGKCGKDVGSCPFDQCCSKYGYCGKTDEYCAITKGCQSEFGHCNKDYDDNGKCGKEIGQCPPDKCCSRYGYCGTSNDYCSISKGCQSEFGKCKCPSGQCCSKYGYCGTLDAYCLISKGCQLDYGQCKNDTQGKCGKNIGQCPSGQCCSKYGYCGKSKDYCGKGCQNEFGKCDL
ncbi:L domain-like protein [Anaeromyces robustus]|uniref:L domain-like protein n=1 Tax=Anaeromyces robustus TaxID=1754192 RepID=A0A1Y1XQZ7_9FUNG|nr:L domain-like protein [Anaeromyces robustus]|eukprot:ORX88191.1 L domain-like protein [Anaeromyces robustus]